MILIFCISCSTPKGNLKKASKGKGVGIISFKVFNKKGEDISNNCIIKYTYENNESTRSYQLDNAPHFLELNSYLNVKKLSCMINLLVYKYDFDRFDSKIDRPDVYSFGEYYFEYDYKADYRETKFYKEAKKCEYDNDKSGYCENSSETWTNEGKLKLLKVKKINADIFEREFPKHGKKIHYVDSMRPRNIYD